MVLTELLSFYVYHLYRRDRPPSSNESVNPASLHPPLPQINKYGCYITLNNHVASRLNPIFQCY